MQCFYAWIYSQIKIFGEIGIDTNTESEDDTKLSIGKIYGNINYPYHQY